MRADLKLDDRLTRAMRGGAAALPGDLALLRSYLRLIAGLLEEKATDLEHDWGQACAAAAEIETLQTLELAVAERAVAIRAESIETVRGKLAIWRALGPASGDDDMRSPRNRLILSVEADLERLSLTPRA
jgi:hypothetical protein